MTKTVTREMLGFADSAKAVEDRLGRPVILYNNEWTLNKAQEKNKDTDIHEIQPIIKNNLSF